MFVSDGHPSLLCLTADGKKFNNIGGQVSFADKVTLHVRQKEISTLVITCVALVIIGVFALVVIGLK
jgi:hypothetical protein